MKNALVWIALILAACAAAWYWSVQRDMQALDAVEVLPPHTLEPRDSKPDPVEHPIDAVAVPPVTNQEEAEPPPPPLPPLENSDTHLLEQLAGMAGHEALEPLLVSDFIISRVVSTVDSLPSARVAPLMSPLKPVPGRFLVLGSGEDAVISPENPARYQPYVDAIAALDRDRLVTLYVRYYPLFQEAYQAQGYPEGYFNDRLVEVIDHLLSTPEPRGLIEVRQNEAVYEFADERLESLSAGQKILLRLGLDNQLLVKQWLRELRSVVTGAGEPARP